MWVVELYENELRKHFHGEKGMEERRSLIWIALGLEATPGKVQMLRLKKIALMWCLACSGDEICTSSCYCRRWGRFGGVSFEPT